MEVYEREFLEKLKEMSKFHTCSYCSILNLLLELTLLFTTKEIVDLIEIKKYMN